MAASAGSLPRPPIAAGAAESDRRHSSCIGVAGCQGLDGHRGGSCPLSLAEIVTALRAGEGRRPGLLPIPPALIALASHVLGHAEEWRRLSGTLVADPVKLMHAGWKPAADTRAGLAALARATSPRNAN